MASLKEVKSRIQSVNSTQQITRAMKMVAAAKLRRAQDKINQIKPYASKLSELMKNVSSENDEDEKLIKYTQVRDYKKVLIMVVTSDRGLCGAFNSNVFKTTRKHIENNYMNNLSKENIHILPFGKKALDYFSKNHYHVIKDFSNVFSPLSYDLSIKATEFVISSFLNGEYDRVDIIYNEFLNVATQNLVNEQVLPLKLNREENASNNTEYIFEPTKTEILLHLIPNALKTQIFKAILDSNAAEHGARMTAMDQATDNADDLLKELKLTYNRTRQAAITKEILEIVGGAEALG